MKRYAMILILLLVALVGAGTLPRLIDVGAPADVARGTGTMVKADEWHLIRAITETISTPGDDTAFDATNSTWSNGQYFSRIDERAVNVSVAFLAYGDGAGTGDPSSGTFSWSLYIVNRYGPIQLVADGTCAVGDMVASHLPHTGAAVTTASNYCFGELPVVSNDYWPLTVNAAGTADQVGLISFDPLNAWGIDLRITSLSGITTLYMLVRFIEP